MGDWFHTHAHSHYSVRDGMPTIQDMVETVVANDQPALALTDHGLLAGGLSLYRECRKAGIIPFPGEEFYLVQSVTDDDAKKSRYHVGLMALTSAGYEKLVWLSSRSHQRERYHRFPLIDWGDLKELDAGNDIALTTGCYFGLVCQTIINQGVPAAVNVAKAYAKLVPMTFVEIQHHHTKHDDGLDDTMLAHKLLDVANKTGLPVIVTQDAHYCNEEERKAHNLMKALTMFGSDPSEVEFPGDSYHLADTSWVKGHYASSKRLQRAWNESLESCRMLVDAHDLRIPVVDDYSFRVPDIGYKRPDRELANLVAGKLAEVSDGWKPSKVRKYEDRISYELGIINDVGFADYFLMVYRIIEFCRDNDYLVRARGSAAGSLVCYLLDITDCDPIEWHLTFDRFLTRERTKPPDIDLDIEDAARPYIVDWLHEEMGSVVQIGTYQTLGYDSVTDRGSIVDDYVRMKKRQTGNWAGNVMADIDIEDQRTLMQLSGMTIRRSAGSHAAGFLLGTDEYPIERYIPTMLIPSSGHTVTQCEMGDVEDAGYVKLDVLGLRYLTTLKLVLEKIYEEHEIDFGWRGEKIPYDDTATMAMLRKRQTEAVFQLEGATASRGCKELGAKRTKDIVLVMSLYRPAALEPGEDGRSYCENFLRNRNRKSRLTYKHPLIEKHLKETYGVSVFQEQVLNLMRDIGMSVEDLNKILKALKMSNKQTAKAMEIFAKAESEFREVCRRYGLDDETTDYVWELVNGFAKYGFNRAHATSYGVLSYRLAYLKCHYPAEYMAATLESTALRTEHQKRYMREARKLGLRIAAPDVNRGGANWRLERTGRGPALRRGIASIKGVGMKAADMIEENQPYESMEDLIERTGGRIVTGGREYAKDGSLKGVLLALKKAGALRSLGEEKE